jgi:hypothetical protein
MLYINFMINICKEKFLKILIYEETNHSNYLSIIEKFHENNYEVYITNKLLNVKEQLETIFFSLIIIEYDLFIKNKKIFLEDLYTPIIILFITRDIKSIEHINKEENIIDYYFLPLEVEFFIKKINFYLQPKIKNVSYKKNLYNYIWEIKFLYEYKLQKLSINRDNYDFYMVEKSSQYILYFSFILNLINNFFLFNQEYSFEKIYFNLINLITLQLCYFNKHIQFIEEKKDFPIEINQNVLYFLLFLILIIELIKSTTGNIEIYLNFHKNKDSYYVILKIDYNLKHILDHYNQMNLERESLVDFIKEYLWEHWKKKINFNMKKNNMMILEFLLLIKNVNKNELL